MALRAAQSVVAGSVRVTASSPLGTIVTIHRRFWFAPSRRARSTVPLVTCSTLSRPVDGSPWKTL